VTVWPDVYEATRDVWQIGNIVLMLVRVRERAERLQAAVQQVTLVQAADGSLSHERFEIPPWLTDAVRASAGVGVVEVRHEAPGTALAAPPPAQNGHAAPAADDAAAPRRTLRFFMHESPDEEDDRRRIEELNALIKGYPGEDEIRLFVHARDGDRIELAMPAARACEELRGEGAALLGPHGGAEPIAGPGRRRTRGPQPLEV
jgi:hypothetical protein